MCCAVLCCAVQEIGGTVFGYSPSKDIIMLKPPLTKPPLTTKAKNCV
jgi:hypothetical protein